jgi:hypothetical protein
MWSNGAIFWGNIKRYKKFFDYIVDWKSCRRQKRLEGSNPSFSASIEKALLCLIIRALQGFLLVKTFKIKLLLNRKYHM